MGILGGGQDEVLSHAKNMSKLFGRPICGLDLSSIRDHKMDVAQDVVIKSQCWI